MMKDGIPDATTFVEIYGGPDSPLSPRLAWSIWTTAVRLADEHQDEATWDLLRDELPRLAQDAADRAWMARFVRGFDTIAARMTQGLRDLSRLTSCTGDEMALHLVIDEAESSLGEGLLSSPELLPEDAERDDDFEWARDVMFRDHDVLLLFDPALDGVDDGERAPSEIPLRQSPPRSLVPAVRRSRGGRFGKVRCRAARLDTGRENG